MLEIFRFVFEVNFFVFPISAGWLTWRKLRGKPAGRPLRMMIMSAIMMALTFIGILINETPENKARVLGNIHHMLEIGE
ncbi:MAG: hypothetical protein J5809_08605 [Selenomonadaceae bacterium]|nr:hypothetical protein [Selenomonadaceae bacterium]